MYFPVLRGRQFELIALRELLDQALIGKHVFPIVEPVKLSSTLLTTLQLYRKHGQNIAIVRNPSVGTFINDLKNEEKLEKKDSFFEELDSGKYTNVLIITNDIDIKKAEHYLTNENGIIAICENQDALSKYQSIFSPKAPVYTLIPDVRSMRRGIHGEKIVLGDKFKKQLRNTDYANNDDEPFSEDHLYCYEEGYEGFADYSIVGDDFSEGGFAPYAVVIHIVYFAEDMSLRIHHFVSDTNDDITDPAGKFAEALEKLIKWNASKKLNTFAMQQFRKLYDKKQYPGLGSVKKLSIMHHLELVSKYLDGVKK